MNNIVGLREFRESTQMFVKRVEAGETLVVMRRSKPLFRISPVEDAGWETVVDFTKFRKGGIPAEELLKKLRSI